MLLEYMYIRTFCCLLPMLTNQCVWRWQCDQHVYNSCCHSV